MGRADNEQQLVPFTCQYHHEEVLYLVLLLSIHMWEGRAVDATEVAFVSDREAGVCCQRNHARCDFFVQRLRFSVRRAPQCMPCPRELIFFGHKVTDCHRQGHGDFYLTFSLRFYYAAFGPVCALRNAWCSGHRSCSLPSFGMLVLKTKTMSAELGNGTTLKILYPLDLTFDFSSPASKNTVLFAA